MLIGQKKNQEREQNWSLVLNPVSNEIDKHKLSQKISQSFKLSADEALDLVNNTPIILLDNLTRPIASQIKDFFGTSHAELFLTNDVYVKRKCYRTVWPDPPSLAFLETLQPASNPRAVIPENHPLAPDEAVLELRSLRPEPATPERIPARQDTPAPSATPLQDRRVKELDQEVSKLKDLLKKAEQKFEAIQEEYRQARGLYESKVTTAQEETRKWKTKLDEGVQKVRKTEEDRLQLEKRLSESALEISVLREEQKRMTAEIQKVRKLQEEERLIREKSEKVQSSLTQDKQSVSLELEETRLRSRKLEEAIQSRDASLYAAAEKLRQTEERVLELNSRLEEKNKLEETWKEQFSGEQALRAQESARWAEELTRYRLRTEDAEAALSAYERRITDSERTLELRETELASWRSNGARLSDEITQLKYQIENEKGLREQLEEGIQSREAALEEAAAKLRLSESLHQSLSLRLEEQTRLAWSWTAQFEREQALRTEETARLSQELSLYRVKAEDAEAAIAAYERKILEMDKASALRNEELAGWRSNSESLSLEIDKLRLMLGDEKISKDKLELKYSQAQEEKESLRASANESQIQLQALQGELQAVRGLLERERHSAQILADQLRGESLVLREKSESLEKSRLRLVKEMEDAGRQVDEWKLKAKDFEHALKDLEQKLSAQDELLRAKKRLLEERDRDLEASRRQVRELVAQLEQRDMIHRRTQLTEQLGMKEDRLKQLIQEQSQLEGEMHQKEEKMRAILTEQERIEKEIVEGKQAQRHYLEQVKREKQPVKPSRPGPADLKKHTHAPADSETGNRPAFEPGS